ncbi:MAG: hypothetical protein RSD27_11015 [Ruthenibacterium sp.]
MKKPTMKEFARDCCMLGIYTQRFVNANVHLSRREAEEALVEWHQAAQKIANKYSMPCEKAISLGITIAESCDLYR